MEIIGRLYNTKIYINTINNIKFNIYKKKKKIKIKKIIINLFIK